MRPLSIAALLALAACTGTTGDDTNKSGDTGPDGGTDADQVTDSGTTDDTTPPDDDPTGSGDTGTKGTSFPADDIQVGELVVTEIHHDPLAVNDELGEWFEVHNASKRVLDLDGLFVIDDGGDYFIVDRTLTVQPGGYLVFAKSADDFKNGGIVNVDFEYGNLFTFGDDPQKLERDAVRLTNYRFTLDNVRYSEYFPLVEGVAMQISPDAANNVDNDDFKNWCLATEQYGFGDLGSPGEANPPCGGDTGTTDDDVPTGDTGLEPAPADSILVGELVITEIMRDPDNVDDSVGEYFEIYNSTGKDIDIRGLIVSDNASNEFEVPYDPTDPKESPILVPALGYFVFGANADTSTNGGVTVDYDYVRGNFILGNGPDEVILSNPLGLTIDQVIYTGSKPDWPDPTGASIQLTNATVPDSVVNDNGSNWCESTALIDSADSDSDKGSPGAANETCPL